MEGLNPTQHPVGYPTCPNHPTGQPCAAGWQDGGDKQFSAAAAHTHGTEPWGCHMVLHRASRTQSWEGALRQWARSGGSSGHGNTPAAGTRGLHAPAVAVGGAQRAAVLLWAR